MKKLVLITLFLLVVFSFSVSARRLENFSATDGYGWLLSQSKEGSYNNNIVDTAAAFLAINAAGGTGASERNYLINQENEIHCWPKTGCKTKDTSWAIMALFKSGENSYVNEAAAWLKKAQTPSLTGGNWWLEIDTPNSGTCTIKYLKNEKEFPKTIKVEEGRFPDCGGGTFFDLKNCLEPGLINAFASLELNIDCSTLNSAKISIAYNSGSNYYLYEEVSETTAILTVKNGCFGAGYKETTCNYESSLYSEWVLSQIGSTLSSELYLRENYDQNNALHNALLFITTKSKNYADKLKSLQKADGSWESNTVSTAFALMALASEGGYTPNIEKAQEWLKTKQNEDGSWDGKVFNTAMVLYSSFYQGVELPSCTDGIKNQGERGIDCGGPCDIGEYKDDCCGNNIKDEGEEGIDCGGVCNLCEERICDNDGVCDADSGEDCFNCPDDCLTCDFLCSDGQQSKDSAEEGIDCGGYCKACGVCNNNLDCEIDLTDKGYPDNEDSQNCPNDCTCGDEKCDDYEAEFGTCSEDCLAVMKATCGDGNCDAGEDISCAQDCEGVCNADGVCDEGESTDCVDCAEKAGGTGLKWIIILLIIIAVGGGTYFFLTKKRGRSAEGTSYGTFGHGTGAAPSRAPPEKPKPKGSFFAEMKPKQQPAAPQMQYTSRGESKSKLDEALEKSIGEAKKLIKGEK